MKVRVAGTVRYGRAIDLRDETVDPDRLVASITDPDDEMVTGPRPGPAHSFVGLLEPGCSLSIRPSLAAAARSQGMQSQYDADIASLDRAIDAIDVEPVDLEPVRRRAANAGEDVAALKERVARLRGHLGAEREADRSTDETAARLRKAIRSFSEAETEALAAEQALTRAEREARAVRDERDRRLSLVDERDNLARRARSELSEHVYPQFRRALEAVPVDACAGSEPGAYDGGPFAAGLAIARIARLRAPIVIADGPFDDSVAARAALDAQVVLV